MEISVDRIVLSGDSVSWKENMSDIERRNLCSALIYPEEKEKGGREGRPEWHLLRLREQHLHNRRALARLRRNSGCIPFSPGQPSLLSSLSPSGQLQRERST